MLPNSAPSEVSECLPPMSSFHRGSGSASLFFSSPHTTHASFTDPHMGKPLCSYDTNAIDLLTLCWIMLHICIISGGQGTTVGGSHAGDALGKALASVRTHIPQQLVQPKLQYTVSSREGTYVLEYRGLLIPILGISVMWQITKKLGA